MRRIQGNDHIIDTLLKGNAEATFHIVQHLRKSETAELCTDGRSYLTAQTDSALPLWIQVNEAADARTKAELCELLQNFLKNNPRLRIIAQTGFTEDTINLFAKMTGSGFSEQKTMYSYICETLSPIPSTGRLVTAEEKHRKDVMRLIMQFGDQGGENMTEESALKFVNAHIGSGNLFLWEDNGIVAMARIAYESEKFTCVNSVVTDREKRGNGYAKMLVGALVKRIHAAGKIPQLYADAANPYSNRAYQKLGFRIAGELKEYLLEK